MGVGGTGDLFTRQLSTPTDLPPAPSGRKPLAFQAACLVVKDYSTRYRVLNNPGSRPLNGSMSAMSSVPVTTPRISKQIAQESHPPVVTAGLHEGNGHALELAKAFYEFTPSLDLIF